VLSTEKLHKALAAFDQANREDPNLENIDGQALPKELIYGQRMSERLHQFCTEPSEALQLAVRAQHICRWKIPRSDYPMDRAGYKRWRSDLAKFHGETAAIILADQGYSVETIERVKDLLLKRGLKRDDDVQTLEDVACLVFIEHYLDDFARKHEEEKLLDIIRKTWNKMSPAGHAAALQLPLSETLQQLVHKAVGG
jgi:hypothetical protein